LWGKDTKLKDGNLFLDNIFGAETEFYNWGEYQNINEIMQKRENEFSRKGRNVYSFPSGGSSALGIWVI
jgi:1-aminocyclopropane-1-carboxylate deaminase/D-cysteine desulfhydrase-like pyridoxal-dependent ACC family enzyme